MVVEYNYAYGLANLFVELVGKVKNVMKRR